MQNICITWTKGCTYKENKDDDKENIVCYKYEFHINFTVHNVFNLYKV